MSSIKQNNSDEYKETELGLLPMDWRVVKVSDVAEFSHKPRHLNIADADEVIFLPMECVPDAGDALRRYDTKKYSEISSGTFVFKNDLLIAKITPSFENGKQVVLRQLPEEFAFATTEVWPIHSKDNSVLLIDHLENYIKIHEIRTDLASKMEGSTGRQRLPRHVISNLKIPLPPITEQQRIAHVLRTVQESKEKSEAVISALQELKKSMMSHLFKYGPVSLEDAEKVRLKETEIGEMPEEWKAVKLGDCCEFLQYGTSKKCESEPVGLPVLRIPNVIGGEIDTSDLKYSDFSDKEVDNLILEKGDILFVRTNGRREYVGRCAVYDDRPARALFASYLIRARLKSQLMPLFVKYYAETEYGRDNLSGRASNAADGKFNINTQTIKSALVPKLPLDVQERILAILSSIDERIETEENKKAALEQLFKSLLHDLMTAKIRVTDLQLS